MTFGYFGQLFLVDMVCDAVDVADIDKKYLCFASEPVRRYFDLFFK